MTTNKNEISVIIENLRKIIVDKGITQATMASFLDKDASQFSKILNGGIHLRVEHLAKIASNLNMSIVDIITYPEKYYPQSQNDNTIRASVTLELDEEKRDRVLKILFETEDIDFLKNK
ncbi:MAG: helix-turn-helix transcriptional regulator [Muribaculaceae bacterium]|nr:helix-turn-helix transcriptional regulator [Muribaculaceae bacterium]